DDALRHELGGKQFAVLKNSPFGESVEVEATLTVSGSTGTGWKIAGVSVFWDKPNYWHLAFVQSPIEEGTKHFVELSENYEGTWLSQSKLKESPLPKLPDFVWETGRPYRLRIAMADGKITGTVSELDGTLRWQKAYAFSAPAVTKGRPALDNAGLFAAFQDVSATVSRAVKPPVIVETTFPPYEVAASTIRQGKKTGFFHTERKWGRWWIIDPNGDAFWAVATDHCKYQGHWCQDLGYSPYHRKMVATYGSDEAWAKSATDRLREWGFNTLGAGAGKTTHYKGLSHTLFTSLGGHFCHLGADFRISYPENEKPTPCSYFPNVFHPRFAEYCDLRAEEMCAPNREDPWLIGYFLDNELKWWGKSAANAYGLFEDTMAKPAGHSAKVALVNWLKKRYKWVSSFNRDWGADVESFEAMLELTELTGTNTEWVENDKVEFVRLIVDRYFRIGTEAIRRHDPNHMVLGCRFAGLNNPAYLPAWEAAGKYCDIVTTNVYEKVDLVTGDTYSVYKGKRVPLSERFEAVNKITGGAPFWVTEWSYPSYDSGLPCKHGAGQRVDTQTERTFAFEAFQKGLFSLPFMVGSSFFMWVDEPALGISEWFPEDSNYGLVNEDDEPYKLLTGACTRLNPNVYEVHTGRTAEIRLTAGKDVGHFVIQNRGRRTAECLITTWIDGKPHDSTMTLRPKRIRDVFVGTTELVKPGGHYVRCTASVASSAVEIDLSDNWADQTSYFSGLQPSQATGAETVVPVVLTNPSASASEPGPLVIPAREIRKHLDWAANAKRIRVYACAEGACVDVPAQLDLFPEGPQLAVIVPAIASRSTATLLVCVGGSAKAKPHGPAVTYRKGAAGFEISNGRLKLVKDGTDGDLFDRVELDGVELGRYYPMLHQALPQNMWTAPDSLDSVTVTNGPVRLILTATMSKSGKGGEVKTTVAEDGTFAKATQDPASYTTTCQVCVYPNRSWFTTRGIDVTNTDSRTWTLENYFHYALSAIGGNATDDEPIADHWYDSGAQMAYGAIDPTKAFNIHFWLSNGGGQHPDSRRAVGAKLASGQLHTEPEATLYIGGAKGEGKDAWKALKDAIRATGGIIYQVYAKP
ncbi:MAG: hypothetical protein HON70_20455, partial [Lentisphaerae bacterium]|nr:hypothetical protein [Lentisphaerota bacterium]